MIAFSTKLAKILAILTPRESKDHETKQKKELREDESVSESQNARTKDSAISNASSTQASSSSLLSFSSGHLVSTQDSKYASTSLTNNFQQNTPFTFD